MATCFGLSLDHVQVNVLKQEVQYAVRTDCNLLMNVGLKMA